MVKIIDVNRHGIRREIDHQFKPKKKGGNKKGRTNARKEEANNQREIQAIKETN